MQAAAPLPAGDRPLHVRPHLGLEGPLELGNPALQPLILGLNPEDSLPRLASLECGPALERLHLYPESAPDPFLHLAVLDRLVP
jgi:hypothetical protein